jgi:hypothetical protein
MTVVAETQAGDVAHEASTSGVRATLRREVHWIAPSLVGALNALACIIVAPNVNDIFAANARESAVLHGVGLKYWFGWFGGGSTPGNYSVLTPYLSAAIGAITLAGIATAAITPVAWLALRESAHPVAGAWVVAFTAGLNLWCGRVPFALGCLMSVAMIVFVMRRRVWVAATFGVLAVASSPVSGAFVLIALAGVFLTRPPWRRICVQACAPIGVSLLVVAFLFGQPGPETFSFVQLLQLEGALGFMLLAASPDWLRTSIWLTLIAGPVIFVVPNGLGDNILRFAWYCLPAAVVATSLRRLRIALFAVSAALALSTKQSVGDVFAGAQQTASPGYYTSLEKELGSLRSSLLTYRLEVVDDGTHTADSVLLDHAMLARGYEYQEDNALNKILASKSLNDTEYKVWLDNNAVGYVAIAGTHRKLTPEYALVSTNRPDYLSAVWHDDKWTVYRVHDPNPIVKKPVTVVAFSQSALVLRVPCACAFTVRVRKPANLHAVTTRPKESRTPGVTAKLKDDGFGWTTMTTTKPGTYTLR